jgi:acyl-CoA reductase-like NAD-dependent aldehyde dehydrogenase
VAKDGMTEIQNTLTRQRQFFNSGRTKDLNFRLEKLNLLKKALIQNEASIFEALKNDLSKSAYEGYLTEIGLALNEIRFASRNLKSWAKPKKVKTPVILWFASSTIYPQPYFHWRFGR